MLIFLEGLPGVGKSTNSGLLYRQFERNGFTTRWVHEMARPHPVLFFNEASLTFDELADFQRRYPESASILDEMAIPYETTVGLDLNEISWNHASDFSEGALCELKEKDVWNFSLHRYCELALEKWRTFARYVSQRPDEVFLLDSCIVQFQIFSFLLENRPDDELCNFVSELWSIVQPLQPRLIYLYRESVDDAIAHLARARGEQFFEYMRNRDGHRRYYQARAPHVSAYFEFLRDYHRMAGRLFDEAPCRKVSIEVSSENWVAYEDELLAFAGIQRIPEWSSSATPIEGNFHNIALDLHVSLTYKDGTYHFIDPNGTGRILYPRTDTEFFIRDYPVHLRMVTHNRVVVGGAPLSARWTESGTVFERIPKSGS